MHALVSEGFVSVADRESTTLLMQFAMNLFFYYIENCLHLYTQTVVSNKFSAQVDFWTGTLLVSCP
jgi:hypothetical protein